MDKLKAWWAGASRGQRQTAVGAAAFLLGFVLGALIF
jgi:hypothetical protein